MEDKDPIICPHCGGTGMHPYLSATCKFCQGTGEITDDGCFDDRYKIHVYRAARGCFENRFH